VPVYTRADSRAIGLLRLSARDADMTSDFELQGIIEKINEAQTVGATYAESSFRQTSCVSRHDSNVWRFQSREPLSPSIGLGP
jgi:hypothetical protein